MSSSSRTSCSLRPVTDGCKMATAFFPSLLHEIEHVGESRFKLQRLFDLIGRNVWIFAIFQKAGTLVFTNELNEGRNVCFPVFRESLEVLENGVHTIFREQGHRVFGVLVEICVKDALVHEIGVLSKVEQNPAQVVQLQYGERVGHIGDSLLDRFSVSADDLLSAGLNLGDDRKAVTSWRSRIDRTVSSLCGCEVSSLGNRHCRWFCPVALFRFCRCWCGHMFLLGGASHNYIQGPARVLREIRKIL